MRFIIQHANESRTLTCDFCKQVFMIPPHTDDVHIQLRASKHLELDHGATSVGSGHLTIGSKVGTQVMEIQAEVPSAANTDVAGDEGIEPPEPGGETPVERHRRRSR